MQRIYKVATKNKIFRKWQMLWHIDDEGLATEQQIKVQINSSY